MTITTKCIRILRLPAMLVYDIYDNSIQNDTLSIFFLKPAFCRLFL